MIDEIHEQWTDPRLPTRRLANETILTLLAQLEQDVGTRIAGFLARVFQGADLFGFTNTNAINKAIVHFYLQTDNGVRSTFDGTALSASIIEFLCCTVRNKVFSFERGQGWLKGTTISACHAYHPMC